MLLKTRWTPLDASAPSSPGKIELPQLSFTHAGITRTLNKHPQVQAALRAGTITVDQARQEPWQLRFKINGKERYFKLPIADRDAIRSAKDIINGRTKHATEFDAFLAQRDARRSVTFAQLAAEWTKAGYPYSKTKPRTPEAVKTIAATLGRALNFWKDHTATSITKSDHEDFVVWRRNHTRAGQRFSGDRSADLELGALSSLCQWAVLTDRLKANPFEVRATYASEVKHCHEAMPDNDEQAHQILAWLIAHGPEATVAAGYLAFSHLSGLRPGEPEFLQYTKPLRQFPGNIHAAAIGQIYRMPDGTWSMKVHRLKNGQNPSVPLHPALRDFLHHWRTYYRRSFAPTGGEGGRRPDEGAPLFPNMNDDRARDLLAQACAALKLPPMKPHGFGRGYFVRVCRSQGADDTAIAVKLGQTTNGKLIRDTYGDPMDPVGGNLHKWLPKTGAPAWQRLSTLEHPADTSPTRPAASNI